MIANCGKFFKKKKWEYQIILPVSWEICMQIKKQQLESMIGSGLKKELDRAVSCHPVYLTYTGSCCC